MTQLEAVGTPAACSILVMEPFDAAKNFLSIEVQPPSELIVNSSGGVGNFEANCFATDGSTGRYPCWAQMVCAAGENSQLTNAPAAADALLVAATGVSISSVCLGTMCCTASPAFTAAMASLSYETSTSPLPLVNVCSAELPLEGWTLVFFVSSVLTYASASEGVLPSLSWAP